MSLTRHFHPVLKARKLKRKPVRVTVGDEHFVLFRDENGKPAALKDQCAHRFAKLSGGHVQNGKVHCPYHNWSFDSVGNGKCPSQPSLKPKTVPSYQVQERYGCLWLAGKEVPAERLPELSLPGFLFGGFVTQEFRAPLHVVLANFSEDEHFPSVHQALGWTEDKWSEVHFESENFDNHSRVYYRGPQRPTWDGWLFGNRTGDLFHNRWVTRFAPLHATFDMHWENPKTGKLRPFVLHIPVFFVPEGADRTRVYSFHFAKIGIPWIRYILPLVWAGLKISGKKELKFDANLIRNLADTPAKFDGMSLGRFDKPLIHNQRLLEKIYLAKEEPRDSLNNFVSERLREL